MHWKFTQWMHNIRIGLQCCACLLLFFIHGAAPVQAQHLSGYGVPLLRSPAAYRNTVLQDPDKEMLELKTLTPGLRYELRYARDQNFVHTAVYPAGTTITFLRRPAALALHQVDSVLAQEGLGLKIFDAYRPYRVTVRFWELVQDERYVAHPSRASGHNRGLAVDLTLVDRSSGAELEMGTGFDHFSDTAHHSFPDLPQAVLRNRKKLLTVMTQFGFQPYTYEWWHYSWPNNRGYEALDLEFNQLLRMQPKRVVRQ
ncbi:MAG TPA: M15 family metallopeptidase [Lacibacter sp.]|nr:M15 family metallopeptidase [Lacibacter sp.]